ncbi:MAG: hypothetical protein RM347_007780 [Nostoc sp. ChiQUE02]|uniref:hypothetical protein n=1 Tax=Nostoc sp. ChiQUE02 TaxID=3075377 RepID=UPI002AD4D2DC|nr:hypothetical protein [Nostoc sp. ChiQUE02]MDZ8232238.1 hypothetical protein [Nostoc sp. ChiQUE02]
MGETRRQSLQRGATPLGGFADLKEVAWEPPQRTGSLIASVQELGVIILSPVPSPLLRQI